MKLDIVRIGNSRGVRIPKRILEEVGFADAVELEVGDGVLTLRPAKPPRDGWSDAFAADPAGEPDLLPDTVSNEADREWTW